jgi:uncharacterized membrane protein
MAGVVAAFLSALHPWHVRYASEARAYAFVLALVPLMLLFFLRALKEGRWRWWAAFGTAAFFLMSYPTCIYILLVLNACAVPAICWRWGRAPMRLRSSCVYRGQCRRGDVLLPLMLPCVPQSSYVKGRPARVDSIRSG